MTCSLSAKVSHLKSRRVASKLIDARLKSDYRSFERYSRQWDSLYKKGHTEWPDFVGFISQNPEWTNSKLQEYGDDLYYLWTLLCE